MVDTRLNLSKRIMNIIRGQTIIRLLLLSLHSKRATYDPQQFFRPWIYAIARYKVIDHARAQKTVSKYIELAVDIAEHEVHSVNSE